MLLFLTHRFSQQYDLCKSCCEANSSGEVVDADDGTTETGPAAPPGTKRMTKIHEHVLEAIEPGSAMCDGCRGQCDDERWKCSDGCNVSVTVLLRLWRLLTRSPSQYDLCKGCCAANSSGPVTETNASSTPAGQFAALGTKRMTKIHEHALEAIEPGSAMCDGCRGNCDDERWKCSDGCNVSLSLGLARCPLFRLQHMAACGATVRFMPGLLRVECGGRCRRCCRGSTCRDSGGSTGLHCCNLRTPTPSEEDSRRRIVVRPLRRALRRRALAVLCRMQLGCLRRAWSELAQRRARICTAGLRRRWWRHGRCSRSSGWRPASCPRHFVRSCKPRRAHYGTPTRAGPQAWWWILLR